MAIDYQHQEYKDNIDRWKLADNVCSSRNIEQYLIELNPDDTSPENATRNKQYKERAVFYPVAGNTLEGLTGLVFAKDPETVLPSELEYVLKNVDGGGTSIYQQSQEMVSDVEKKARGGLLVSYPKTERPLSKAEMDEGKYLATITKIDAEQIINWRTITVGAKVMLSIVVIAEVAEEVEDDGYSVKNVKQIRELFLDGGVYYVRLWRQNEKKEWVVHEAETAPTDAKGKTWEVIPFMFVGALSNTPKVDNAPIYPMCKINLSHYRNSADYEDSVWFAGQAQPWMSGVDQNHITLMQDNNMYVGSRMMLAVPQGEQFGFASAEPNPMVRQAMLDKLDMMIGSGARHIQGTGPAKTATEAEGDAKAKYSGLALVSANVSEAYTQALMWAARYMGASDEIEYTLNKEFVSPTATAQDIQAMVGGFVQGALPMSTYFGWLKKVGLEDEEKTLDEFAEEVGKVDMPDLDEGGVDA